MPQGQAGAVAGSPGSNLCPAFLVLQGHLRLQVKDLGWLVRPKVGSQGRKKVLLQDVAAVAKTLNPACRGCGCPSRKSPLGGNLNIFSAYKGTIVEAKYLLQGLIMYLGKMPVKENDLHFQTLGHSLDPLVPSIRLLLKRPMPRPL